MASQAQIDANRRNAQSSTGPHTQAGKAAVASNAFKPGLRANIFKQPMTDPKDFDQFLADLVAEHQPQTSSEAIYVERMALCLNKLAFLEGMQIECLLEKSHQFDLNEHACMRRLSHQALNVYWGQENRLERAYDRAWRASAKPALDRLRALQKERLRAHADLSVPDPGCQTTSGPSVTATLPIEELAS